MSREPSRFVLSANFESMWVVLHVYSYNKIVLYVH